MPVDPFICLENPLPRWLQNRDKIYHDNEFFELMEQENKSIMLTPVKLVKDQGEWEKQFSKAADNLSSISVGIFARDTNAIHVEKYFDIFRRQHGFEVTSLFKQTFHSNEIGYRKPSVESFEEIIRLSGIHSHESLFIDDSAANIEGAIASGMKGLWLQPEKTVEEIFQQYL